MQIQKNIKVEQVSLRNVKIFVPRENLNENNSEKSNMHNLRKRKETVNYAECTSSDEY